MLMQKIFKDTEECSPFSIKLKKGKKEAVYKKIGIIPQCTREKRHEGNILKFYNNYVKGGETK